VLRSHASRLPILILARDIKLKALYVQRGKDPDEAQTEGALPD